MRDEIQGNREETRPRRWIQKLLVLGMEEPLGAVGVLLLLGLLTLAIASPLLTHRDPVTTTISKVFRPPSNEFWFGTDQLGRDVWSRFVYGSRTSLLVGVGSVALASIAGGLLGIFSGLMGGKVDL